MRFNTFISGKFGNSDGAVEISGNEIIVFRKSPFTRALFGAIGTAVASGKEVCRFTADDVATYRTEKKAFKNSATFVFKDGSFLSFDMKDEMTAAVNGFMARRSFVSEQPAEVMQQDINTAANLNEHNEQSIQYVQNKQSTVNSKGNVAVSAQRPVNSSLIYVVGALFAVYALLSLPIIFRIGANVGIFNLILFVLVALGAILVTVGLFSKLPVLSIVGSGLSALHYLISCVLGLISIPKLIFSHVGSEYILTSLFSFASSLLYLGFWILLLIIFAKKHGVKALCFTAGGLEIAEFLIVTVRNLVLYQTMGLSITGLLSYVALIAGAFLLSSVYEKTKQ